MNHATKIVTENAVAQWSDMGFEDDYIVAAAELQDYYTRLMGDFCENYDEQWFALIATPAIQKTIDWEAVAEAVNNMLLERQNEEDDSTRKTCSRCSEQSSCGNYNDDKEWVCEGCFTLCDHCDARTAGYHSGGDDVICLDCQKRYDEDPELTTRIHN